MTCGIYAYEDKVNKQIVYIGASTDCEKRHKTHYAPSNINKQTINYVLQNDIDDRYSYLLLLQCPKEALFNKEHELIKLIQPKYNNISIDVFKKNNINTSNTSPTGFYCVTMNGQSYAYRKTIHGCLYQFYNTSIRDLEYVVKKNNLLWFIVDIDKAKKTLFISDNKKYNTLYYNVRKRKPNNKQGYIYVYKTKDITLKSRYIEELEYNVKNIGLEWRVFKCQY